MAMMKNAILLLPFLFAGCSPVSKESASNATTPTPSTPTQATPAPTVVTPAVVIPTLAPPAKLSAEEEAWATAAVKALQSTSQLGKSKEKGLNGFVEAHATLRQGMADYNEVPLPTKFTKADFYIRQGFAEEEMAYLLGEMAIRANDTQLQSESKAHYLKSGEFFNKAADEITTLLKK